MGSTSKAFRWPDIEGRKLKAECRDLYHCLRRTHLTSREAFLIFTLTGVIPKKKFNGRGLNQSAVVLLCP